VQMAGVQKEKVTKKGKTNKGGPKRESVKKTMQLILTPLGIYLICA